MWNKDVPLSTDTFRKRSKYLPRVVQSQSHLYHNEHRFDEHDDSFVSLSLSSSNSSYATFSSSAMKCSAGPNAKMCMYTQQSAHKTHRTIKRRP